MQTKPFKVLMTILFLSVSGPSFAEESTITQPDNSAVNTRDQHPEAKTADHQSKSSVSDVELTRLVRREITKASGLSTYAKNIKIYTKDGMVTLRGPVHTDAEKMKVASLAQKVAGQNSVQNELEIKQ